MRIKVKDVRSLNHETVKSLFTLVLVDIGMSIKDCKLVLTKNKQDYFIGFPSSQIDGRYVNFIFLDKDSQDAQTLQSDILKLVTKELERQSA